MHKPNNLLETDVREQLDWDPVLDDSRIVVKAKDGNVTLSGSVPTYYDSYVAKQDVWSVGGVSGIDDQLLIGLVGEAIDDAAIASACSAALSADRLLPPGSVTADVMDGWVTLSGEVRRHYQRQAAQHAVRRIPGVLGISDNVTITADPIPGDVADRISKALGRNALTSGASIDVTNSGHTIYLDGKVGSYAAMVAAEDAAWAAPGVTDVIDHTLISL